MSQQELLGRVAETLEAIGVAYMLTGSLASSSQGEPRATHDVDLVIETGNLREAAIGELVRVFAEPDYYLDETAVRRALREGDMFNLLDLRSGDKVDFWPLTVEPFDQSRFGRRQRQRLFGREIDVSSPEDTILMKLKWARESGGSEKHFVDALRVYELQCEGLEVAYLELWAANLGIMEDLERLRQRANPA